MGEGQISQQKSGPEIVHNTGETWFQNIINKIAEETEEIAAITNAEENLEAGVNFLEKYSNKWASEPNENGQYDLGLNIAIHHLIQIYLEIYIGSGEDKIQKNEALTNTFAALLEPTLIISHYLAQRNEA